MDSIHNSRRHAQQQLLDKLNSAHGELLENAFTWIYNYFQVIGVAGGERLALQKNIHPLLLEPLAEGPWPSIFRFHLDSLATLSDDSFDLYSLRWLKFLDLRLKNKVSKTRLTKLNISGLTGSMYTIHRRNHFIASHFRCTWEGDQGRSIAAYAKFHLVIPQTVNSPIRVQMKRNLGSTHLQNRLELVKHNLSVMLWPLDTTLDFPSLDTLAQSARPTFIRLDRIRNEGELLAEIEAALSKAKDEEVTILVFPELSITERISQQITEKLKANGADGFPILTLFGCCHCPDENGQLDLNEAVLLGPEGTELFRQRKLNYYTANDPNGLLAEHLSVGDLITIAETPLGNLTILICLDFFHTHTAEIVSETHANLILVPSLSPKTSAHRNSAAMFVATNLASSFVCNRWIEPTQDEERISEQSSFYHLPRSKGVRSHRGDRPSPPYMTFSLRDHLQKERPAQ